MKTIYFIRHAKAEHNAICDDYDRNLTSRGETDALMMATRLQAKGVDIEKIISSSAKRTLKTAKIFAKILGVKSEIKQEKRLYACSVDEFLQVINEVKDKFKSIAIVAHNDEITQICEILSDANIANIPTSGVYAIKFEVQNFSQIVPHSGKTLFFDYPKKIIVDFLK